MLHDEVDGVADLSAAEAFEDLLRRRYGERGSLLVMKRAKSKVVGAPFLQRHELLDDVDDLSSVEDPFYGWTVDHGVKIEKRYNGTTALWHNGIMAQMKTPFPGPTPKGAGG
jgi:hypothetical protein